MGHVYYHHPADKQFSLDFVNPDPENLVSQIVDYDGNVAVKVMEYELDTEFYGVYTSRVGGGAVSEIELDISDALADMTEDNGTIAARLLEIYRALLSQNAEEEGTPVEAYKNIDIDALPEAFDETSWEGTANRCRWAPRVESDSQARSSQRQPSDSCGTDTVLSAPHQRRFLDA